MFKAKRINAEHIFIFICVVFFFTVFLKRLLRGIELSDEAYYCATGYRLLMGGIPFGDMWEMNAGSAYVMLPFLWLRSLFCPVTEGIQRYLRLCYMIPNFFAAWALYAYMKEDIRKEFAFLLSFLFFFYAPFQLYTFSYNSIAYTFNCISMCTMLLCFSKRKPAFLFLSGLSMAVAVLSYPTMFIYCLVLALTVLLFPHSIKRIRLLLMYALGGLSIAVPVLCHIISNTGLSRLISNLQIILSASQSAAVVTGGFTSMLADALINLLRPYVSNGLVFSLFWIVLIITALFKKTKPAAAVLVMVYPFVCCYYAFLYDTALMQYIYYLALLGPVCVLLSANKRRMMKKYLFLWLLSLGPYFVVSFSSGGGLAQSVGALILSAVFGIKLVIEALSENSYCVCLEKFCAYLLIIAAIGCELYIYYCNMYGDDSYPMLSETIESGVFKGLNTSPWRAPEVLDKEVLLKKLEDKGKSVMVLYHSCYAYLMLDMVPKTPSTWGCVSVQNYGFDNEDVFMEYLSIEDNIPEIIFLVDSIDYFEPYYSGLKAFVDEHYSLTGIYEEGLSGPVLKYELIY